MRFNAFLTGWENDHTRPFVLVWMIMDVIRNAELIMARIMVKVEQVCLC